VEATERIYASKLIHDGLGWSKSEVPRRRCLILLNFDCASDRRLFCCAGPPSSLGLRRVIAMQEVPLDRLWGEYDI
jgi:hypothetical protein